MKKFFVLCAYILLFWIILPGMLVYSAVRIDRLDLFGPVQGIVPGILVLCFALPMLAISIVQFRKFSGKYPVSADPPDLFIRTGLYSVWRHPIYLFYTLTLIGIAMVWGSGGMLFISIPAFILLEVIYIIIEERILVLRFGMSYLNYRKITPVVIPRFYFCLKIPCFFLFRSMFSYRVSGTENIPDSPPFFLVSTHRNYLDPFYLAQALPYPIRYITTFEMYRRAKTRWFFKALDCIPKKRYLNDISTGREILKAIRQDAVIGVFPEGERVWTGVKKSMKPETLNLFMKFKHVPILPVRLQGNFFAWPRWGKKARRAHVKVEFLEAIVINNAWNKKQLEERVAAAIDPGDLNHPDFYCKSQRRIQDISKILYRCPLCRSFESHIYSSETGECKKCGGLIHMDERYHLSCRNKENRLEGSIEEIYQSIRIGMDDLENLSSEAYPGELRIPCREDELILASSEEVEWSGESFQGMDTIYSGPMVLTDQRLVFTKESHVRALALEGISSLTTESNYKLQLYDSKEGKLHQLVFCRESVLKWQDLIAAVIQKEYKRTPNLR